MHKLRNDTNKIIIHCSASDSVLDGVSKMYKLHTQKPPATVMWNGKQETCRGWIDIAYHYIIDHNADLVKGRPKGAVGAGVYGHNHDSVHLCMMGLHNFSYGQFVTLYKVIEYLKCYYKLNDDDVYGHYHFDNGKSCPNFRIR